MNFYIWTDFLNLKNVSLLSFRENTKNCNSMNVRRIPFDIWCWVQLSNAFVLRCVCVVCVVCVGVCWWASFIWKSKRASNRRPTVRTFHFRKDTPLFWSFYWLLLAPSVRWHLLSLKGPKIIQIFAHFNKEMKLVLIAWIPWKLLHLAAIFIY